LKANTLKRVFIPRIPLITHICDGLGTLLENGDRNNRNSTDLCCPE
jgi:hypothetical protein